MSDSDELLRELRRGERDGFVRYFQLFRTPVYGFTLRLLRDENAAVAATAEALSAAFRRIILDDDISDLPALTYRCALDACVARAEPDEAIAADGDPGSAGRKRRARRSASSDMSRRFEAALAPLDLRQQAALLLHDVYALNAVQLALVFSLGVEAAGALLFRAREEFRRSFEGQAMQPHGRTCRQAEQATAGAVGLGLGAEEWQRLHRHAAYCKPCRRIMQGWPAGASGLALALLQPPPPQALAALPVFGEAGLTSSTAAAAGASGLARVLGRAGRLMSSKAVAYVVAAACLALTLGVVARQDSLRPSVLFESVGPAIQLVTGSDAEAARPGRSTLESEASAGTSSAVRTSPAAAPVAIGAQTGTTIQPLPSSARPSVPESSATAAPPEQKEPAESADGGSGDAASAPDPTVRDDGDSDQGASDQSASVQGTSDQNDHKADQRHDRTDRKADQKHDRTDKKAGQKGERGEAKSGDRDSSHRGSSHRGSSDRDSSHRDSSHRDSSDRGSSHRDSSDRDSSDRDSSHRDSSDRGSSHRDSSDRGSSHRDSSDRGSGSSSGHRSSGHHEAHKDRGGHSSSGHATKSHGDSGKHKGDKTGKKHD